MGPAEMRVSYFMNVSKGKPAAFATGFDCQLMTLTYLEDLVEADSEVSTVLRYDSEVL